MYQLFAAKNKKHVIYVQRPSLCRLFKILNILSYNLYRCRLYIDFLLTLNVWYFTVFVWVLEICMKKLFKPG